MKSPSIHLTELLFYLGSLDLPNFSQKDQDRRGLPKYILFQLLRENEVRQCSEDLAVASYVTSDNREIVKPFRMF